MKDHAWFFIFITLLTTFWFQATCHIPSWKKKWRSKSRSFNEHQASNESMASISVSKRLNMIAIMHRELALGYLLLWSRLIKWFERHLFYSVL
ncbi:ECU09_0595 [Encephalitozoon cuniculi GB-M1]|uniref:ECU09_0595 protein n=1 Tax=Encephalitozoon cuniculi (strain GB-M1) TaxID=284813 RepID=I7IV47_ENCCU|nr:uncharacterized protein ECU09_0595 [Encephalitozoon cuniculi GB-M1]CCI73976.1 ECU09_0595 [Encephalitozoon cuniculi GB-M1]